LGFGVGERGVQLSGGTVVDVQQDLADRRKGAAPRHEFDQHRVQRLQADALLIQQPATRADRGK
jgi:hypothetical protein